MRKLKTVLSDQNRVSKLPGSYLIFQFTFGSTRLIILEIIASAENAYIVHLKSRIGIFTVYLCLRTFMHNKNYKLDLQSIGSSPDLQR